ncbi:hypothetical protein FB567DRAFT_621104 [Paraphoma chrysanthemicola]|uniref:NADAR domain-containing protein n=1 Tax=Paraphoma chrysanthemicola TaxID=798071 RepID=A0A8K0R7G3_9PLEO|nr:hypothetical protein FB567DRAFT_621104 [Paraphoma chrysanthemicola]
MPPKRKPNAPGRAPNPTSQQSTTIYFYAPNSTPYGTFSQWYPSPLTIPTTSLHFLTRSPASTTLLATYAPRIPFTCAEQVHMFAKALLFGDAASCVRILARSDPKEQKKLGKRVKGFNEYKWTRVKSRVVRVGNWYKFTDSRNEGLKEVLLGTGERELVEAAKGDRVWGIGFGEGEAEGRRGEWGENRLGEAVMAVRRRIRMCEARGEEGGERGKGDLEWDGGEEEEEEEEEEEVGEGMGEEDG